MKTGNQRKTLHSKKTTEQIKEGKECKQIRRAIFHCNGCSPEYEIMKTKMKIFASFPINNVGSNSKTRVASKARKNVENKVDTSCCEYSSKIGLVSPATSHCVVLWYYSNTPRVLVSMCAPGSDLYWLAGNWNLHRPPALKVGLTASLGLVTQPSDIPSRSSTLISLIHLILMGNFCKRHFAALC